MTEEQLEAKKKNAGEKIVSMKRRDDYHDYKERRMYMITLEVEGRLPVFGHLEGDAFAEKGSKDEPRVVLSELGKAVEAEWFAIPRFFPQIEIRALQMMPDHMHGILFVKTPLPVHLGHVISGFKTGCRKALRVMSGWQTDVATKSQPTEKSQRTGGPLHTPSLKANKQAGAWQATEQAGARQATEQAGARQATEQAGARQATEQVGARQATEQAGARQATEQAGSRLATEQAGAWQATEQAGSRQALEQVGSRQATVVPSLSIGSLSRSLFAKGYNDLILRSYDELATWENYLRDNPRRLLMKRARPKWLLPAFGQHIGSYQFSAIGNLDLLSAPWRLAVRVSRRMSDVEIKKAVVYYLEAARRGAVLVSPAISPGEKQVMRAAFNEGLPTIVIMENGFTPFSKPHGEQFYACGKGILLMLSPFEHHNEKRKVTAEQCKLMNLMALEICK